MLNSDALSLDCTTCVATNTTACNECVVSHLLANDAGPIEFVPTPRTPDEVAGPGGVDRAVALFAAAGMLDHTPHWVDEADFVAGRVPQLTA
jgi:hypothetical protein